MTEHGQFESGENLNGTQVIFFGGADRDRTDDLLNAIQALSQLSYGPTKEANGKKKQTCCRTGNIEKPVAKVKSAIHSFIHSL